MKHKTEIEGYDFDELAEKLGDLRYDKFVSFLYALRNKIAKDCVKDHNNGKVSLARHLNKAYHHIADAESEIQKAWDISRKYMDDA